MKNPNDISAEIYDLIRLPLKGSSLTDAELEAINFIVAPGSNILDIGAGTGRHALELVKQGFKLTALDSSAKMLAVLQKKATAEALNIKIICANILKYTLPLEKFNLALLMWNTFNEIVLTEQAASLILENIKRSLVSNGYILINVDNAQAIDPAHFDFSTTSLQGTLEYSLKWTTQAFDFQTNTATSLEEITLLQEDGTILQQSQALIKQRYWKKSELEKLAQQHGFTVEYLSVRGTEELYLLLKKNPTN